MAARKPARPPITSIPLTKRTGYIRYELNWQATALRMQYERLVHHLGLSENERLLGYMQSVTDLDYLVITAHRIYRLADIAKGYGIDRDGELKDVIGAFRRDWKPKLIKIRDALEHLDHGSVGLLPYEGDGVITFASILGPIDVHELYKAADELCQAISRAVASCGP
ncbi:MAG: hypothetical protein ACLQDY_02770 [Streptosporangiaceae bacterium]